MTEARIVGVIHKLRRLQWPAYKNTGDESYETQDTRTVSQGELVISRQLGLTYMCSTMS